MGCGKSKLDAIANGNFLTRKKSSVNGAQEAVKEEEETKVPENGINKEEKEVHQKASIDNVEQLIVEGEKVAEEEEKKELEVVEGEEGLVSKESPDKYFSSRHQRENSLDNKSEYSSPRVDSSKESPFNGDDHPVDGTITTETTTETTVVEEKEEKPSALDEPNVVPVGEKDMDSAANQV